jgi:signal transduction histidine kinase
MPAGEPVGPTRLTHAIAGAEAERRRWARELHDETLQGLGALRLVLASGRRGDDPVRLRGAVDEAVGLAEREIDGLRRIIRELRPPALDEFGLGPAIDDLASRTAARHGVEITTKLALDPVVRYAAEVEVTLYRVVEDALTNAVRDAGAVHLRVEVSRDDGVLHARVTDDGHVIAAAGSGLEAMRERVSLLGGTLVVDSSPSGTSVSAALRPARPRA